MRRRSTALLAFGIAGALVLAACGDDSGGSSSDTTAAADTTTTVAEGTTTTTAGGGEPSITVTPDTGLTGGQEVTITGSGYSPDLGLGINQCADENDPDNNIEQTGSEHCDLANLKAIDSDANGDVNATYTVSAGPFGEAGVVCDATHDCVISVGELSADPDVERATTVIKFA